MGCCVTKDSFEIVQNQDLIQFRHEDIRSSLTNSISINEIDVSKTNDDLLKKVSSSSHTCNKLKTQLNINVSIFANLQSNQCSENDDTTTDNYITNCTHLQRLATGLMYHHSLSQNVITNDEFIQFCQEIYKQLLDDHCHLIKYHHYHLDQIQKELESNYSIPQCDIINCKALGRQYRDRTIIEHVDKDFVYAFYMDCFDRIHHQIYHISRLGLRIRTENGAEYNETATNDKDTDLRINKDIIEMKRLIFQRRSEYGLDRFQRYQTNSKFTIPTSESYSSSDDSKYANTETSSESDFNSTMQFGEHIQVKLNRNDISISQLPTTSVYIFGDHVK